MPDAADLGVNVKFLSNDAVGLEVATQARRLSSASPGEAASARQVLEFLRGPPVLAGVHNPAGLANLPEPERQERQAFWQEVEGLLPSPPGPPTA